MILVKRIRCNQSFKSCDILINTKFTSSILCRLFVVASVPVACNWCIKGKIRIDEIKQQCQQHWRCKKASVCCFYIFFYSWMPPIFNIVLFLKTFINFYFKFMKCHYFWSKCSTLFHIERFTFHYGHSVFFSFVAFSLLITTINNINLFKPYLHWRCTCDAIMTSKVKLDIRIFFIHLCLTHSFVCVCCLIRRCYGVQH